MTVFGLSRLSDQGTHEVYAIFDTAERAETYRQDGDEMSEWDPPNAPSVTDGRWEIWEQELAARPS